MDGLSDVIRSSAPMLADLLGGSYARIVLDFIGNALGISNSTIATVTTALTENPEARAKLKQLENDHADMLGKLYQTEVDDRKDARKNAVLYKDFLRHMAYLVTVGFFCALLLLFMPISINPTARELLSMLVGMLASKWQTIIDFFYGSSRQSKGKLTVN